MKETLKRSRALRRMVRWCRSRTVADPRWRRILDGEEEAWREAVRQARGPRVLLATTLGGFWAGSTLESLLAVALTLRGARVGILLCDGILPACQACEARSFRRPGRLAVEGPQATLCDGCFSSGLRAYGPLGLEIHRLGENLTPADVAEARRAAAEAPLEEIDRFEVDGVRVGEHAMAGALRFFARGDMEGEPGAEPILRRYLEAAILTLRGSRRILERGSFDCAAFHHGIYVPQGVIGDEARRQAVRVVNWNPAYRKRRFIFSHGDTYHHTLLAEPTAEWENLVWEEEKERALLEYLKSRWRGTEDWIWFHDDPLEDPAAVAHELRLDPGRPVIVLLTNVIWDAQLHYSSNVFPSMMEWVMRTIERIRDRPDLQLVIRVHPAEVRGTLPSRQRVDEGIRKAFPALPANVTVVPPESRLGTYALMASANAALIYGTKTGVELAATGVPVVVAGEAWVRGKGFTLDATSARHYDEILEALPFREPLRPEVVERARKYAYHFFFRRMIPIDCMEPTGGDPPFRIRLRGLSDLAPGSMAGLDVILDGILQGTPFVYPAETLERDSGGP